MAKIYVCGYEQVSVNDHASLWTDGSGALLASTTLKSYASGIAVSNAGDVYTAGWDFTGGIDNAKIWKNGVATILSTSNSRANSVFISGSDVYVAGFESNGSKFVAKYWKNGTQFPSQMAQMMLRQMLFMYRAAMYMWQDMKIMEAEM